MAPADSLTLYPVRVTTSILVYLRTRLIFEAPAVRLVNRRGDTVALLNVVTEYHTPADGGTGWEFSNGDETWTVERAKGCNCHADGVIARGETDG